MESSKVTFRITSIILSIYPVVILILKSGYELLYKIWSSFGSGPMQLEGKIIPFGDLIHLTAAASCNQNPTIGSLVCDPWGRPLNQNIIVIRLIKTLHLTNITILGILTYLFFAVIVLAYIKRI